jgi:protein-disulfide isomerase
MLRALRPSAPTNCSNPFEQIGAAATKLDIDATPTLIFDDGGVIKQFASAEVIERFLKETPVVAAR